MSKASVLCLCVLFLVYCAAGEKQFRGVRRLLVNTTAGTSMLDPSLSFKPWFPQGQFGAACNLNSDCLSGSCSTFYKVCVEAGCQASCYTNPLNTFCWAGFCYPKQSIGGRCRINSDCSNNKCYYGYCSYFSPPTCSVTWPSCPAGTYCGDVNFGSGYCYSQLPAGTPCDTSNQCQTNYCDYTKKCALAATCPACAPSQYCSPATNYQCVWKLADGASCTAVTASQCQSNFCNPTLNVCTKAPGSPCYGPGSSICPQGQYCQLAFAGWTCALSKANDAPCASNSECQSNFCNTDLAVCTTAPGNACWPSTFNTCPRGQYCAWGWLSYQCTVLKSGGQYCAQDSECFTQYCLYNVCTTNTVAFSKGGNSVVPAPVPAAVPSTEVTKGT